jgi:hypothetical protein
VWGAVAPEHGLAEQGAFWVRAGSAADGSRLSSAGDFLSLAN